MSSAASAFLYEGYHDISGFLWFAGCYGLGKQVKRGPVRCGRDGWTPQRAQPWRSFIGNPRLSLTCSKQRNNESLVTMFLLATLMRWWLPQCCTAADDNARPVTALSLSLSLSLSLCVLCEHVSQAFHWHARRCARQDRTQQQTVMSTELPRSTLIKSSSGDDAPLERNAARLLHKLREEHTTLPN